MIKENLTPELMRKLAKVVDHMLNPTTKGETGFCVFVYPHEEGDIEALYVSNSQVEDVKKAVKTWLEREEIVGQLGAQPTKVNDEHQRSVNEMKQETTRKYQGKRIKDTQHSEDFDYNENRDWQALYHYPERFEIVGPATGEEGQDA